MPFEYRREEFSDALVEEFKPLLAAHWCEVAHYADLPMAPRWEQYRAIAAAGAMRVFTVRDGGRLIGYSVHIVTPSLHYGVLSAQEDVLYVAPEHRRGSLGRKLVEFADLALQLEGVVVTFRHVKLKPELNFGPLLARIGYEPIDQLHGRRLDRE